MLDLALIVYGILLWGLFNVIPVTMTLPGIAGLILTIGVAADANVVIFERIKEEVSHGKTVRSAVTGYALGFKTILDANILVMLTAVVLFIFATAQPEGFAVTLILGVIVQHVHRRPLHEGDPGVLAGFAFFNRPSLMGVSPSQIQAAKAAQASAARAGTSRARSAGVTAEPATQGATAGSDSAPAGRPAQPRRKSTSGKRKKRR